MCNTQILGAGLIGSVGYDFLSKREGKCCSALERGLEEVAILRAALFVKLTVHLRGWSEKFPTST